MGRRFPYDLREVARNLPSIACAGRKIPVADLVVPIRSRLAAPCRIGWGQGTAAPIGEDVLTDVCTSVGVVSENALAGIGICSCSQRVVPSQSSGSMLSTVVVVGRQECGGFSGAGGDRSKGGEGLGQVDVLLGVAAHERWSNVVGNHNIFYKAGLPGSRGDSRDDAHLCHIRYDQKKSS